MSDWYGYLCGESHSEPTDPAYRRVQAVAKSEPFNRFRPEIGSDVYRVCEWPESGRYYALHTIAVYDHETGGAPKVQLPLPRVYELRQGDTLTWRLPDERNVTP